MKIEPILTEGRDPDNAAEFSTRYWVANPKKRNKLEPMAGPTITGYALNKIAKSGIAESQLAHALLQLQAINCVADGSANAFKNPHTGRNTRLELSV